MELTSESLSEIIFQVINNILSKLFSSVDKTIYSLLDTITFIDESILEQKNLTKILGEGYSSGIILICNALATGFFIFYATQYLISHLTYKKIQKPSQFIFKAIIFIGIMNSSLWLCKEIIYIVSLITKSINTLALDIFHIDISFTTFIKQLNSILYSSDSKFDVFSFDGIIKSFSSFGMISLIFSYSLRYVLIQIFVILCPFAFLSLLSENTERFFRAWITNFISLLVIQIFISIILILSFTISDVNSAELKKLLYIAIIFAITRTNSFIKELIGGISFEVNQNFNILKR